jgi:surface antigen
MRVWTKQSIILALGSLLAFPIPLQAHAAAVSHGRGSHAKPRTFSQNIAREDPARGQPTSIRLSAAEPHSNAKHSLAKNGKARLYGRHYAGISCVPFARSATGIELQGNAAYWWYAAAGVYERGSRPEEGSVLDFRASGRMRLGHVAVVTRVINSREVEIDHANWWGPGAGKGGVSRGTPVVDVSENNDWSAVRVGLGRSGTFGSVYGTYGFIYDRPDHGMMVANNLPRAPMVHVALSASDDEVAEAVEPRSSFSFSAPVNHSMR